MGDPKVIDSDFAIGGFRVIDEMFAKVITYITKGFEAKFNKQMENQNDDSHKLLGFRWQSVDWKSGKGQWISIKNVNNYNANFHDEAQTGINNIFIDYYRDDQLPSIKNNKGIINVYTVILVDVTNGFCFCV